MDHTREGLSRTGRGAVLTIVTHLKQGVHVWVVCFHTDSMADPVGFCSSWGYKTQKENLKVACANLDTGLILFTYVLIELEYVGP